MNQDPNPQEGDLAAVYSNQQSNMTEDSVFSKITLPETVILDTAIEDYFEIGFLPIDESIEMDCMGNLDSNMMNVDIYMMSEGTNYRISYESQDGLTYTRSIDTPEEIDFGFDVKFGNRWGEVNWDDRIGQFFIISQSNFNGLYQYNKYNTENLAVYNLSEAYIENNKLNIPILNRSLNKQNLITLLEYIYQLNDNIRFNTTVTMDEDNNIYVYYTSDDLSVQYGSASAWILQIYYDLSTHIGYLPTINNKGQNIDPVYIKKYKFNSQTNVISEEIYNSEYIASIGTNIQSLITEPYMLFGGCIAWYNGETKETNIEFNTGINIIACNSLEEGARKDLDDCWYNTTPRYKALKYMSAPTQLTTKAEDVYTGIFYGGNGVQTGTLLEPTDSKGLKSGLDVWYRYDDFILLDNSYNLLANYQYEKLPNLVCKPSTYNIASLFSNCHNLQSVNLSRFDTSNTTDLSNLFSNDRCLYDLDLSSFNTVNITNMYYTFTYCTNLVNINGIEDFDTSNVTTLAGTFAYCQNLTNLNLSNWDTSNVTKTIDTFICCENLTNLNISNWNTSNLTSTAYMFQGCNNLVNINLSKWDSSNITDINSMFRCCNNLSDESIQSIINFCLNCTNLTVHKNLSNRHDWGIFMSTNISNARYQNRWSELTAAGWKY